MYNETELIDMIKHGREVNIITKTGELRTLKEGKIIIIKDVLRDKVYFFSDFYDKEVIYKYTRYNVEDNITELELFDDMTDKAINILNGAPYDNRILITLELPTYVIEYINELSNKQNLDKDVIISNIIKEQIQNIKRKNTYVVQYGDSLYIIARKLYGDCSKWEEIFKMNRDIIKNSDLIRPYMVLRVPEYE